MNSYDRVFCSGFVIASADSSMGRVSFRLVNGNVFCLGFATACVGVSARGVDSSMVLGDLVSRGTSCAGFLRHVALESVFFARTAFARVKSRALPLSLPPPFPSGIYSHQKGYV